MTAPSTFVFADIAGFTALTEAHGDEDAAELALEFGRRVRERLRPGEGDVVKTIGDAVLIRMAAAAPAVRLGLDIVHDVMEEHGEPSVSVGMHEGPAVERDGDFFGSTVNLAARIAAMAAGGEVLISGAVCRSTGELEAVRYHARGARRMRNVAVPVDLWAVTCEARLRADRAVDPVCRMAIVPGREARRITHAGTEYLFCSEGCAALFGTAPAVYATAWDE